MKALIQKEPFLTRPTESFQKQVSQTKEGGTIPLNLLECETRKPVICLILTSEVKHEHIFCTLKL